MPGLDETESSYRVRQVDPSRFDESTYRTIDIKRGIKAVVGKIKGESNTTIQTLIFDKSVFKTAEMVRKWISEHAEFKMSQFMENELICFANESKVKKEGKYYIKEIARVGKHKDSKGRTFKFTREFFDELIKKTKEKGEDIFVPLGHPVKDRPIENTGWLADYWREGDSLFGKFEIKDEETAKGIDEDRVRHNSIGLMRDLYNDFKWYLQHVALTFQPMINGLGGFKAVAFGGAEVPDGLGVALFSRMNESEDAVDDIELDLEIENLSINWQGNLKNLSMNLKLERNLK